ncbi:transmembrane protein 178A-like [Lethenteron reissneri]|uniref:transmembrane protein 178A-like n=1 Tax=Lethenteron reissneri TaxID=7753 RepID=UPI002AB6B9A7|nr:transmembrane protein 178A-like [Lethenteron reissneri]
MASCSVPQVSGLLAAGTALVLLSLAFVSDHWYETDARVHAARCRERPAGPSAHDPAGGHNLPLRDLPAVPPQHGAPGRGGGGGDDDRDGGHGVGAKPGRSGGPGGRGGSGGHLGAGGSRLSGRGRDPQARFGGGAPVGTGVVADPAGRARAPAQGGPGESAGKEQQQEQQQEQQEEEQEPECGRAVFSAHAGLWRRCYRRGHDPELDALVQKGSLRRCVAVRYSSSRRALGRQLSHNATRRLQQDEWHLLHLRRITAGFLGMALAVLGCGVVIGALSCCWEPSLTQHVAGLLFLMAGVFCTISLCTCVATASHALPRGVARGFGWALACGWCGLALALAAGCVFAACPAVRRKRFAFAQPGPIDVSH